MSARDTLLGTVKLRDRVFGPCSESDAIEILHHEACALGANVVNIVDEERSDFSGPCYECRAELVRSNAAAELVASGQAVAMDSTSLAERMSRDAKRGRIMRLSMLAGIAIAFFCIGYFF